MSLFKLLVSIFILLSEVSYGSNKANLLRAPKEAKIHDELIRALEAYGLGSFAIASVINEVQRLVKLAQPRGWEQAKPCSDLSYRDAAGKSVVWEGEIWQNPTECNKDGIKIRSLQDNGSKICVFRLQSQKRVSEIEHFMGLRQERAWCVGEEVCYSVVTGEEESRNKYAFTQQTYDAYKKFESCLLLKSKN